MVDLTSFVSEYTSFNASVNDKTGTPKSFKVEVTELLYLEDRNCHEHPDAGNSGFPLCMKLRIGTRKFLDSYKDSFLP